MASKKPDWSQRIILIWPFLTVGLLWGLGDVRSSNLDFKTNPLWLLPWLETKWIYAYVHIFTILPVFMLSFDKRVHYYTYWRSLFPAITIMAILFILWDAFFGNVGVWGFNDQYLLGGRIWGLPWEECLFFFTVPFASFFIFVCLNIYFPRDILKEWDRGITLILVSSLLILGVINIGRLYTATTFILMAGFLLYHYIYVPNTYRTLFYRAYIVILVPFLLVNGLLTGAFTEQPVVVYNPEEFMGIRIVTIPVEDAIYGFLLMLGVIYIWHNIDNQVISDK